MAVVEVVWIIVLVLMVVLRVVIAKMDVASHRQSNSDNCGCGRCHTTRTITTS